MEEIRSMTRDKAIQQSVSYFENGEFLKDLKKVIEIPSESQTEEGLIHCGRYLDEIMKPTFCNMDFDTKIFQNPIEGFGPVLLATRIENPSLPTVLGYGHGDVVRGMAGQWDHGREPWTTSIDGERVYGRGTADNKGQHWINMISMKNVLETRGALGFNAKFLIETGEENGSLGLREVIAENKEDFASDVFLASDGPRVRRDIPTVC